MHVIASDALKYWDARVSPEHMEELWKNPNVFQEWTKSGERRGKVRFSIDAEKKPYLSRVEVKVILSLFKGYFFLHRNFTVRSYVGPFVQMFYTKENSNNKSFISTLFHI